MRQNEDMRKISAWVAIAAVPTLIAGIYGMNFEHMPELQLGGRLPDGACSLMASICRRSCTAASSGPAGCRPASRYTAPHDGRLHLLQDRGGRAARRDRPGGRAHARVHGHQPVDARPRARDPAQALAQPLRRRRTRISRTPSPPRSGWRCGCATRSTATGSTCSTRCEPAAWQTVFHLHIHVIPRYDGRPAPAAGAAAARPSEERAGRGRGRSSAVAERARLERDGDLGVLVIDDQPLNLFDAELVRDILAALDEADGEGCRARSCRAEGKVLHRRRRRERLRRPVRVRQARELHGDLLRDHPHASRTLPFPTLASVHGLCLTAGWSCRWPAT